MGHVGFGGVAEVGVGGGGCFEAETDVLAAAGDGGPVEEFVRWGGGIGGGCFLAFGGGGGGHGCGEGGASAGACEMGGKIGGECESGRECEDVGAGSTEVCNEH